MTRRRLLGHAAVAAPALAFGSRWVGSAAAARRTVPLPSPARVRADFKRMVDFGPRLTGNRAHNRFVEWLEREFTGAGLELLPCDVDETSRWEVGLSGRDVLDGAGSGPVKVATYFPRSKETPPAGLTAPLVYGGSPPPVSADGTDVAAPPAGLAARSGAPWA